MKSALFALVQAIDVHLHNSETAAANILFLHNKAIDDAPSVCVTKDMIIPDSSYLFDKGKWDQAGEDLDYFFRRMPSWGKCQDECKKNPACRSYTYGEVERVTRCFLWSKTAGDIKGPKVNSDSGERAIFKTRPRICLQFSLHSTATLNDCVEKQIFSKSNSYPQLHTDGDQEQTEVEVVVDCVTPGAQPEQCELYGVLDAPSNGEGWQLTKRGNSSYSIIGFINNVNEALKLMRYKIAAPSKIKVTAKHGVFADLQTDRTFDLKVCPAEEGR